LIAPLKSYRTHPRWRHKKIAEGYGSWIIIPNSSPPRLEGLPLIILGQRLRTILAPDGAEKILGHRKPPPPAPGLKNRGRFLSTGFGRLGDLHPRLHSVAPLGRSKTCWDRQLHHTARTKRYIVQTKWPGREDFFFGLSRQELRPFARPISGPKARTKVVFAPSTGPRRVPDNACRGPGQSVDPAFKHPDPRAIPER